MAEPPHPPAATAAAAPVLVSVGGASLLLQVLALDVAVLPVGGGDSGSGTRHVRTTTWIKTSAGVLQRWLPVVQWVADVPVIFLEALDRDHTPDQGDDAHHALPLRTRQEATLARAPTLHCTGRVDCSAARRVFRSWVCVRAR